MADYDLTKLHEAGERAARAAYKATPRVDGAINWGDLHCVAALRVEYHWGEIEYRVEIEEAAPDNAALQGFIHARLEEDGFPDVAVYTEW